MAGEEGVNERRLSESRLSHDHDLRGRSMRGIFREM